MLVVSDDVNVEDVDADDDGLGVDGAMCDENRVGVLGGVALAMEANGFSHI